MLVTTSSEHLSITVTTSSSVTSPWTLHWWVKTLRKLCLGLQPTYRSFCHSANTTVFHNLERMLVHFSRNLLECVDEKQGLRFVQWRFLHRGAVLWTPPCMSSTWLRGLLMFQSKPWNLLGGLYTFSIFEKFLSSLQYWAQPSLLHELVVMTNTFPWLLDFHQLLGGKFS